MQSLKQLTKCVFVLVSLSACAQVEIKDAEWCGDFGPLGASCFHSLTDDKRDLSKEEWDALRFGQVCSDSTNYANMAAALLKLCKVSHRCNFEDIRTIEGFVKKIEEVQTRAGLKSL